MFISFDQLPYPSPFTVQAPANPIRSPASSSSYNTIDSGPAIHSSDLWLASCALPATPARVTSLDANVSIGRPQNIGHRPTAPMFTLDKSAHDSPEQADKTNDEPLAASPCVRTRPQAKGPRASKQRDILPYFIEHPRERPKNIAVFSVKHSTKRKRNMGNIELRATDRDRQ
jgi:hypothetical protein